MGYQAYWSRTLGYWAYNRITHQWVWIAPTAPAIQNVSMFSSGLDRTAINGISETGKDIAYFNRISSLLHTGMNYHMVNTETRPYQYTKQEFIGAFGNNVNAYVHYDLLDPSGGSGGMNP